MQHLLKSLVENKYVYHCRKYPNFDDVRGIFWAHPNGIKFFNMFSTVLVLDSIYMTNKYCFLLIEFVGATSIKMMFSIAFSYMMFEKEDKVTWTLKRCRDQLHSKDTSSKVVVIDQKNALMNVVDTVFQEASSMLCEYHIRRNVRAKCKTYCNVKDLKCKDRKEIKSGEVGKTVMISWEGIGNSDIDQAYIDNCNRFKVVC